MSNLNTLFDVVRGWPGPNADTATITETFRPDAAIGASTPLREGDVVMLNAAGNVIRAESADWGAAADVEELAAAIASARQFWLVVDGNEMTNYDTLRQTGPVGPNGTLTYVPRQVTCIRGTYMVKTENFVSGLAYEPGKIVGVSNGQLALLGTAGTVEAGAQPFGEVREYDAVRNTLTVTV